MTVLLTHGFIGSVGNLDPLHAGIFVQYQQANISKSFMQKDVERERETIKTKNYLTKNPIVPESSLPGPDGSRICSPSQGEAN